MPQPLAPEVAQQNAAFVTQAMDVLGERWMIAILLQVAYGARRFNQIQRNLDISSGVLTDKLRVLTAHGLIEQRSSIGRPGGHEYVLTAAGQALQRPLSEIVSWAHEHLGEA